MARSEAQERQFPDTAALNAALALDITHALGAALDERGKACLVVPGGRTPVGLFEQLSRTSIGWQGVGVTLTDERWVDAASADSNEHLVRAHLLRGLAATATLTGLKNPAPDAHAGAAASWSGITGLPRPFDFVVLGMGDDGHFASLFPRSAGLERALDPDAPPGCVAMRAPVAPEDRLSLNLPALLDARRIGLLIVGEGKRMVLARARAEGAAEEMPVRALLRQTRAPVTVYWAP